MPSASACRSCTSCAGGSAAGRWRGSAICLPSRLRRRARSGCGIFTRTADGFALAEEDVRLRGGGEFFGTRQHGVGELRFADLAADAALLHLARKDAFALVAVDATLAAPEHAGLKRAVLEHGQTLELAAVG